MGILDTIESMAGQGGQGNNNSQVAGGLMQALDEHPGGLQGVIQNFQQNGMAQHVQNWSNGQQQTATPEQIQQGVGNTGLIENVAAKAGISPEMAKIGMAVVLPMVLAHFTNGGQQAPPSSGFGGMAGSILGKFL